MRTIIIGIFFYFAALHMLMAQNKIENYDSFNDTLIYVCDTLLTSDKIYLNREVLLSCDSLSINQKGLRIVKFTMSAIALGQNASLSASGAQITEAMKDELINEDKNFKFIYIKNIILRSKDGRELHPSTESIKIVFLN